MVYPDDKYKATHLLLAIMFFLMAISIVLFAMFAGQLTQKAGILGAYIAILIYLLTILVIGTRYLMNMAQRDERPLLHAPFLLTAWLVTFLWLPGLLGLFFEREYLVALQTRVGIDWIYFIWGWLLIALGVFCLWLGYLFGLRLWKPLSVLVKVSGQLPSSGIVFASYATLIILSIVVVSITGIAYGADRTQWGVFLPFAQVVTYLSAFRFVLLALIALRVFKTKSDWRMLVFVLLVEIFLAFTSGFMKPMLRIAIIVIASAYFAQIPFSRVYRYFVVFLILGVLIVPTTESMRFQYRNTYDNRSLVSVLQVVNQSYESSWGDGVQSGATIFADKMGRRQAEVSHMPGVIIKMTPEIIPHKGIVDFLMIPLNIIPRFLWLDKPILSQGVWFSITYLNHPPTTNSSSAMTVFGEPYIYAGWGATALAMLVFGVLLAFLYRNTVSVGLSPIYIALIPAFIDVDSQFSTQFTGLVQTFVVYTIIYLLLIAVSSPRLSKKRTNAFVGKNKVTKGLVTAQKPE